VSERDYSQPQSELAAIADMGMQTILARVEDVGGEVENISIFVTVNGMVPDGCSVGYGFEDAGQLLVWALTQIQIMAHEVGIPIQVIPIAGDEN
jgi:hypothetical protein